jgi:hypothetical protein
MKKRIGIPVAFALMVFYFGTVWATPQMPREPVMLQSIFNLETYYGKAWPVYTVPSDKIFVIETISTRTILYQGETVVQAGVYINSDVYMLPVTFWGCSASWCYYNGTQQLRLYAGPGSEIGFVVGRDKVISEESANGGFYLSGYLLPKDSPSLAP